MSRPWDKYLLILTTTREILLGPLEFGNRLEDTPAETRRATVYLGEGVIFFYSLFQAATFGAGPELPYSEAPFSGEILAGAMIAASLVMGLVTHPVALWFSGSNTSVHGSLASFLYWSGFCLFVIPPIFVALIMGSASLFSALPFSDDIRFFSFMAIGVPFFFMYYIGTISSWIGTAYRMGPIMGGMTVATSYALSVGTGVALVALVHWTRGSVG